MSNDPTTVLIQPRRFQPRLMILPLLVLAAIFAYGTFRARHRPVPAGERPEFLLEGGTMGTTYHIRVVGADLTEARVQELGRKVESVLEEVNREMSPFRPDSEITRFNKAAANTEVPVSPAFERVVRFSLALAERSGGAFDPTVLPLVNLWGFGPKGRRTEPPTAEEVAAARALVGYRHIAFPRPGVMLKDLEGVQLDLAAVAKGYGVDAAAAALADAGVKEYMVEIGGEVVTAGHNKTGEAWRVGIDRPRAEAPPGADLAGILHLSGQAVASSGDYRNFFEDEQGEVFCHILDPREGRPVRRPPTGISVIASDCLTADGLATTMYVLGPEQGLPWIRANYPGTEAGYVERQANDTFLTHETEGFAKYRTPAR